MRIQKFSALVLTCALTVSCLNLSAHAMNAENANFSDYPFIIIENDGRTAVPYATGPVDVTISAKKMSGLDTNVYLAANEIITFDCTYTPASVSVDFGYIAPDGLFYSVNSKNGSINKGIKVSRNGSYTIAIRNNSDSAITVTGTINY